MYDERRRDLWLLDPWCRSFLPLIIFVVTLVIFSFLRPIGVEEVEITPVELDYIVALPLVTVAFFVGFSLGVIVGKRSKKEEESSE